LQLKHILSTLTLKVICLFYWADIRLRVNLHKVSFLRWKYVVNNARDASLLLSDLGMSIKSKVVVQLFVDVSIVNVSELNRINPNAQCVNWSTCITMYLSALTVCQEHVR
jgi:hypothetical protein